MKGQQHVRIQTKHCSEKHCFIIFVHFDLMTTATGSHICHKFSRKYYTRAFKFNFFIKTTFSTILTIVTCVVIYACIFFYSLDFKVHIEFHDTCTVHLLSTYGYKTWLCLVERKSTGSTITYKITREKGKVKNIII